MIVQMKKVSLVILEKDRNQALKALRKAGVVHMDEVEGNGETLAKYKETYNKLVSAEALLSEIKVPKNYKFQEFSKDETISKATRILELVDRKKSLLDNISANATEIERLSAWGTIDLADFEYLEKNKVFLSLYEIPTDKMRLIGEDVKTVMVNSSKSISRFLVLSEEKTLERPAGLPPEAFQVVMPEKSTDTLASEIQSYKAEIDKIDAEYNDCVKYRESVKTCILSLQGDIEFENIYSGMGKEEGSIALSWLTGYVPVDSMDVLSNTAKEQNWALAVSDPEAEDNVPTKLKNNKLVSLIYPLTDFLGTVPGYHEYDISGWFLLFFTIFFGMIFGDGGYGLLVTIAAIIMIGKDASKKKGVSPISGLMLLLGLATVVWGLVTCTWFGLKPEQLPSWLVNLSIQPISNGFKNTLWRPFWHLDDSHGMLTTDQNLQIFCFTLAFLQLSVAHIKGMKRNCHSLKFLGELGSMLQLWGMYYVVLSMVVSSTIFAFDEIIYGIPIGTVSIGLVAFGFALSFIFSNYDGSIGKSILESCKNIISVLLGVVNVFSDIVSYIRLWAVGLAGAAISNTVNEMAGPLWGHAIMFVAFLLLVVFGHGLNMVLNLLSVIVHGVRLNTLEFSTHLGMSWSGFKYSPFSDKN